MLQKEKIVNRTALFGANRCIVLLDKWGCNTVADCLGQMVWEASKILHPDNGDKRFNRVQKSSRKKILLIIKAAFCNYIDKLIETDTF